MEDKKQQDIALFRYGLIAPVLNEASVCQMEYFRKMSKKDVPYLGRKKYKAGTFKSWLRDYRDGGFDALKPKVRADKGRSRKIDDELGKIIKERVEAFAHLRPAALYRLLISEGDIKPDQFCEETVRKYIKEHKLIADKKVSARKKFEKEQALDIRLSAWPPPSP
jgi:transposase